MKSRYGLPRMTSEGTKYVRTLLKSMGNSVSNIKFIRGSESSPYVITFDTDYDDAVVVGNTPVLRDVGINLLKAEQIGNDKFMFRVELNRNRWTKNGPRDRHLD